MSRWTCGIVGCQRGFESVERLVSHQISDHPSQECRVCGELLPAGFAAIKHAFDEHTRADYVRAYGATSDDIRYREEVKDVVENQIDVQSILNQHQTDDEPIVSAGD